MKRASFTVLLRAWHTHEAIWSVLVETTFLLFQNTLTVTFPNKKWIYLTCSSFLKLGQGKSKRSMIWVLKNLLGWCSCDAPDLVIMWFLPFPMQILPALPPVASTMIRGYIALSVLMPTGTGSQRHHQILRFKEWHFSITYTTNLWAGIADDSTSNATRAPPKPLAENDYLRLPTSMWSF